MFLALFLIILLLIFPFILSIYIYYDDKVKRVYFAIYLFAKIKIISGYLKIRKKGGFYIHLTENKALIIDINTLKKLSGGPDYFKNIQISEIYLITDCGVRNINFLFSILAINNAIKNYAKIKYKNNEFPIIASDLNVYNQNIDLISIKIKITCAFNLICILKSVFANYKSVGVRYVKRKKRELKRAYS